ncbi:MAG: methyltransferase domain-containing protein, partial [Clostridiales bacterium]|nr:methyltransferase domain-containing protein [Clostridiales bacterium]
MDYMKTNKQAWEEAFEHRGDWCGDLTERLQSEELPFLNDMLKEALRALDLQGKTIAQFCCNNGRELFSAMRLGAKEGYGFDIAENMIAYASDIARETKLPCTFLACNILDIGAEYDGKLDLVFFTIGAITWFKDLRALFSAVSRCLKSGGTLLINDYHPFVNMLPLPGEEGFDPNDKNRVACSYFRTDPWLEQNSAGYMSGHTNKHTFVSFSHTMGNIISAAAAAELRIVSLRESDRDVGMTDAYDGKGFPLSYTLRADKAA